MPAERLPMRQVGEVLRLKHACGQSGHRIAAAIGISRYTVAEYLRRAAVVGITWPVPPALDDTALERKLFTPPGRWPPRRCIRSRTGCGSTPTCADPASRCFCSGGIPSRATGWIRLQSVLRSLRRLAGSFVADNAANPSARRASVVDYAGQTVEVIDAITGEVRTAQIFVGALGASNLTYAEARWTQRLADWVGCHVNAFASLGGVTPQVVCDN